MHGIIHNGLRRYVETRHGVETWRTLLKAAGIEGKIYFVVDVYSDDEITAIINAASRLTGTEVDTIHEDFGVFITPDLLRLGHALIRPHWTTIDLFEHTESTMHGHVRRRMEGVSPPELRFERTGENTMDLYYDSWRQMPGVARGIIRGVAAHFEETVTIDQEPGAEGETIMHITRVPG